MEKVLVEISEIIQEYNKMNELNGERLNILLKNLTTRLYYLETQRSEFHKQFNAVMHGEIQDGQSAASAKNKAERAVPELYMLRRIMEAGYENVGAMRTNISFLKSEMNNSIN